MATDASTPSKACENCGAPLCGRYCHRCGQPARSFIRALPGLIGELATETFHYDSRMWRTLNHLLFKPGFLSSEHVNGRRARYTPPIRLYLITSIIAFLVVSLAIGSLDYQTPDFEDGEVEVEILYFEGQPWHPETNPVRIAWMGDNINRWINDQLGLIENNAQTAARDPGRLLRRAASLLPQTMFVILPVFSAWVGVLYLISGRFYIEHLLLQVHNHAFVFLGLTVLYLLDSMQDYLSTVEFRGDGLLAGVLALPGLAILLWMPVYILLSQKRFYGQGWVLTTVKFLALGASYLIMLLFALAAVIVLGMWRL